MKELLKRALMHSYTAKQQVVCSLLSLMCGVGVTLVCHQRGLPIYANGFIAFIVALVVGVVTRVVVYSSEIMQKGASDG